MSLQHFHDGQLHFIKTTLTCKSIKIFLLNLRQYLFPFPEWEKGQIKLEYAMQLLILDLSLFSVETSVHSGTNMIKPIMGILLKVGFLDHFCFRVNRGFLTKQWQIWNEICIGWERRKFICFLCFETFLIPLTHSAFLFSILLPSFKIFTFEIFL